MAKTNLITPAGFEVLREELDHLWRVERPQVTQQVKDAAALGDRSENAEYIYGKKKLRQIDGRVRFLSKRLEALKVVDSLPSNRNQVFFGAWVTIEVLEGNEKFIEGERVTYRIVGPDEWDHDKQYISVDSPMAKGMLKKQLDDDFKLNLPSGLAEFIIVDIKYDTL